MKNDKGIQKRTLRERNRARPEGRPGFEATFWATAGKLRGNLGLEPAGRFHQELHKDLKADYILANPPFNMSDWDGRLCENLNFQLDA